MLDKLPELAKAYTKATEPIFDMDAAVDQYAGELEPPLHDEISEAAIAAMLLVGWDGFDMSDPRVSEFLKYRTRLVSGAVNQETDKQLRSELAEGIKNGETIDELRARIERVYGFAASTRAERIARTETIRAENFAAEEAWRQSELVTGKEWYTRHDEHTCPYCADMDGVIVSLELNFFDKGSTMTTSNESTLKIDFDDIGGPPLHANCRCTLLPVLID